jgi:hypothetical protein
MELSNFTMQVLKNFATVNSNVVIQPGNSIMTMAEPKNILGQATVPETFTQQFGIYDLQEFLNVLGLVDSPRVRFETNHVLVGDSTGRAEIKYFFSDPEMLTSPSKPIAMPEPDVTFSLDQSTLNNLKRAASALGHSQMSIRYVDGLIRLSIVETDNSTSNTYAIDVDGESKLSDCNFIIDIANLKLIPSDYKVEISTKLISQFTSTDDTMDLKYWIALEKTSTFEL